MLQSWLAKLPARVTEGDKTLLLSLFDWLVPPCLRVATKMVKQVLQIVDINLVCSCMRLLESHLDGFRWALLTMVGWKGCNAAPCCCQVYLQASSWSGWPMHICTCVPHHIMLPAAQPAVLS